MNREIENIIDLDVLAPQPVRAKLAGGVIEIHPSTLEDVIRQQRLFTRMKNSDKVSGEEAIKLFDDFKKELETIAPATKDKKLTFEQMRKIIEVSNIDVLSKHGVDIVKKKVRGHSRKQ